MATTLWTEEPDEPVANADGLWIVTRLGRSGDGIDYEQTTYATGYSSRGNPRGFAPLRSTVTPPIDMTYDVALQFRKDCLAEWSSLAGRMPIVRSRWVIAHWRDGEVLNYLSTHQMTLFDKIEKVRVFDSLAKAQSEIDDLRQRYPGSVFTLEHHDPEGIVV